MLAGALDGAVVFERSDMDCEIQTRCRIGDTDT